MTAQYDAVGNVSQLTDKLGRATTYAYDALDRLTTITDPALQISRVGYDAVGNVTSTTDELGRVWRFVFDANRRAIKQTAPDGNVLSLTYDGNGNIATIVDQLGRTTHFRYDAFDSLVEMTDALGGVRSMTYDAVDNLISSTDKLGRQSLFAYDTLNRLTQVTDPLDGLSTSTDKACCGNPAPQPTTNRTAAAQIVRQLLYRGALVAVRQRLSRRDARQAAAQGENGESRFNGAGCAEHVAGHRLGGTDRQTLGMITEGVLDRLGFGHVPCRCGRAVGVDVVDGFGRQAGIAHGIDHAARRALAAFAGLGNVVRIGAHAEADQFRVDRRPARLRALQRFQYEDSGAVPHHESVAILVERPAGPRGLVVAHG